MGPHKTAWSRGSHQNITGGVFHRKRIAWAPYVVPTMACLLTACSTLRQPSRPIPATELIEVPAGFFVMGSDEGPRSSRPARRVYLDSYFIERTETPESSFRQYLLATGLAPGDSRQASGLPAAGVTWRQADGYCRSLGRRLPTEAEWEKAARGDDARDYPWGTGWDETMANTADAGPGAPMPPGSFPQGASPFSLLDMSGNVAEWVADYFDPAYYLIAPEANPLGPVEVLDHGLRGGSWASTPLQATTYFRDSSHSVRANPRVGFRCAATTATGEAPPAR